MTQPTTTVTNAAPAAPLKRYIPEDIRQSLADYKKENLLTDKALGKLTGTSETQINRALNDNFVGNEVEFLAKVSDFLKNDPARRQAKAALFQTEISAAMKAFLETVRRTEDIGIAYCPAGKGKTCGIALYVAETPTAVSITLSKWSGGANGLERAIFDTVDTRAWKGNTSRGEFIVQRFRDSRRLIVIDNAHRMTRGAREWIFDFHDATGCPIALVGNPELLTYLRGNDQQFSRVGVKREIKGGKLSQDVSRMIALHWPTAETDGGLFALVAQVAKNFGSLRAVKKQLLLAKDIAPDFDTAADAFRAAHTQLIRDYALEA